MAITLVNSNTNVSASTTALPVPLRIVAHDERYLIVVVSQRDRFTGATSVRWWPSGVEDGTSQGLTFLGRRAHTSQLMMVEIWGLLAPTPFTTSSARVNVAYAVAAGSIHATAILLSGVDQTTPYVGYPGVATNLGVAQGLTLTDTTTLTVQTPNSKEMVVLGVQFDVTSLTNPAYVPVAGQQYIGHKSTGTGTTTYRNTGAQLKTATTTTTAVKATIAAVTTSRNYVIAAIPFNAATSVAPQWVSPPVTAIPNNINFASGSVNAVSTAEFNATNTPGIQVGKLMQGVAAQLATYTGIGATVFTGIAAVPGGSSSATTGERLQESGGWGGGSAATLNVVLPSTAAVDDIAIVSLYTEDNTGDPTSGGKFTLITSNSVVGAGGRPTFRHCTYYRRVVAGDLTNEAARVTTFTNTTGAAVVSALVTVYRNCLSSGSPVDVSASSDISAPSASSSMIGPDVTTTVDDATLVTLFAQNATSMSGAEGIGSIIRRKAMWRQHIFGDAEWRTAGAVTTGNRHITAGVASEVSAVTIALKPASGGATYDVSMPAQTAMWGSSRAALTRTSEFNPTLYSPAARDYYARPFAETSIWNTPISTGAMLGAIAQVADPGDTFNPEDDVVCLEVPNSNLKPMWYGDGGSAQYGTKGAVFNTSPAPFKAGLVTDLTTASYKPNGSGGQLLNDGATIQEGQWMAANPNGEGMVYALRRGTTSLTGDGRTWASAEGSAAVGGHGGSFMSGVGGVIRHAELTGTEPIKHALKTLANGAYLFGYNASTNPTGYVWPAEAADTGWRPQDGNPGALYYGTDTNVRMGTLLTLDPSVDVSALLTVAFQGQPAGLPIAQWAQRIAQAIQDYGVYIVDMTFNAGYTQMMLAVESGHQNVVGSPSYGMVPGANFGVDPVMNAWASNLSAIFALLKPVTNNTATTIGGGSRHASLSGALSDSSRTLTVADAWGAGRAALTSTMNYHRTMPQTAVYWQAGLAVLSRTVELHPALSAGPYWDTLRATVTGQLSHINVYNPALSSTMVSMWGLLRATLSRTTELHPALTATGPYWLAGRAVLTRTSNFKRTLTVTAAWGSSRAVLSRTSNYKRTLTVAVAAWGASRAALAGILQSTNGGLTFGTYPLLWLYTAANYVNCNIYFEAQLVSGDTSAVGAQLCDVTGLTNPAQQGGGTVISPSFAQTSAPHNVFQRVRSGNIAPYLIDGHVYRADMNRLTSSTMMTMVTALIIPVEN